MASFKPDTAVEVLRKHEFSDFVIKCDDAVFHVHEAIICPVSSFLAACVKSNFKEGIIGELVVNETTPQAMGCLLYYIYSGRYDSEKVLEIWPELAKASWTHRIGSSVNVDQVDAIHDNEGTADDTSGAVAGAKHPRDDSSDDEGLVPNSTKKNRTSQKSKEIELFGRSLRVYELATRFMIDPLKVKLIRSILLEYVNECGCLVMDQIKDPGLNQSDICTVLRDIQDVTEEADDLRLAVVAWCISHIGSYQAPFDEAVKATIEEMNPSLMKFGRALGGTFRDLRDFKKEMLTERLREHLKTREVDNCLEAFSEEALWEPFGGFNA